MLQCREFSQVPTAPTMQALHYKFSFSGILVTFLPSAFALVTDQASGSIPENDCLVRSVHRWYLPKKSTQASHCASDLRALLLITLHSRKVEILPWRTRPLLP